ncbi:MAG: SIS domain-containing protein [Caldilineaceae bacterium]|jgi:glucosamine--fructose-6-phosphate aminotransferase (isomerizing)|nr:SIS domain-containing protein [Caldilineaceae bacterium]
MSLEQSHLYREIHEQPTVLKALIERERPVIKRLASAIRAREVEYVVIAARGTSDNAGRYAQYLFGAINQFMVALATPSLYSIYQSPPRFGKALVIGISQSGKSPDIVSVLAEARRQGAMTAAITNFPDSDLGRQAEHVITLHAGEEHSIAATKTYTASLAAIAALSIELKDDEQMRHALRAVPEKVDELLALSPQIGVLAERYRYMRDCVVLGRGFSYATAFEFALKMKELTYTIAESYSSADFMHGPLALIEHGFPAFVIAPSGVLLPEMKQFMQTLQQREAEIVAISDDAATLALGRTGIPLPTGVPEWLSPLTAIVPCQLFAMHLAAVRDFDPDHPRGLRKVTETR